MTHLHCGELLCDDCALAIRADIRAEWEAKGEVITALDENDAAAWPIVCDAGEADSPQHCAQAERCRGAIQPSNFVRPIGAFLRNPLTSYGRDYAIDCVSRLSTLAIEVWAPFYGLGVPDERGDSPRMVLDRCGFSSEESDAIETHLTEQTCGEYAQDLDTACAVAEGVYWWGTEYHGGQWSRGYCALSRCEFTPGASQRELDREGSHVAALVFDWLVENVKG